MFDNEVFKEELKEEFKLKCKLDLILSLPSEFKDKFFSQGLISKEPSGEIILVFNDSPIHYFVVKFKDNELHTIKLSDVKDVFGVWFVYNNEDNCLEFSCDDIDSFYMYKDTAMTLKLLLERFKDDFLKACEIKFVHIELFGDDFKNLPLVEEREVSLGHTEKIFETDNGKVMLIPCDFDDIGYKSYFHAKINLNEEIPSFRLERMR